MDVLNPIQILPAERGWRAAFVNPDTKDIIERPIVAWALCQPSDHTPTGAVRPTGKENSVHGVVHLDGKMVPVGDCTNFVGYLEPGTTLDLFLKMVRSIST